jgi:hypothetical protein
MNESRIKKSQSNKHLGIITFLIMLEKFHVILLYNFIFQ